MLSPQTHIEISLAEIAPDLLVQMGERGFLSWSKDLTEEIRCSLSTIENEKLDFTVETKPLRGAATKSGDAILVVGTIAITIAGHFGVSEKAQKVAKVIWSGLKKAFQKNPKSTSVELVIETSSRGQTVKNVRKLKVVAEDSEAVLTLLGALKSHEQENAVLRITPKKK